MRPSLNTAVRNEADRIVGFLTHAATYCEELVVVDCASDDGTAELAEQFGATVIRGNDYGTCEPSRPLAADHTANEWILVLDADETLIKIDDLIALGPEWDAANLARITYVDGERFTNSADRQLRYWRKGAVRYAAGMHQRNEVLPAKALYRSTVDPWIMHIKTSAEQLVDDQRCARLAEELSP